MSRKKGSTGTLGKTVQVTYRLPSPLYDKLLKIAESIFQPVPVVLRMAAAEYVKNHRPVRHLRTGIALQWPPDVTDGVSDGTQLDSETVENVTNELGEKEEGNENG